MLYAKSVIAQFRTSQHRPCEIYYHYELMKVKASLTIMIKIGNGFLFGSEVGDKPRAVMNFIQFIFKLLQDHFMSRS